MAQRLPDMYTTTEHRVARPELGLKRLCPNCGAKYYDLNKDPVICPMCGALYATGAVAAARPETASDEEDDDLDTDDSGIEMVALEEADGEDAKDADEETLESDEAVEIDVSADDDALIDDDDDDDDSVSEVVRGADGEDEDT